MIRITENELLELGAEYGLTNDILGYSDFEKLLVLFGTKLYVKGFNDGKQWMSDHMLLSTCDCWEA